MRAFLVLAAISATVAWGRGIRMAPVIEPSNAQIIPGEYIVSLREPEVGLFQDQDYSAFVDAHLEQLFGASLVSNNAIMQKYDLGYAAVLSDDALDRLRVMEEVDFIEMNQVVYTTEVQNSPPSWGLDRIDQVKLPLDSAYHYSDKAGEGVDVYVIDTGININHTDFEGRATWGLTAPDGDKDEDGNGHGTHVASTIGGKKFGVAKKANVIAVKVLRSSGYGSMADVVKGVTWAASEHVRKARDAAAKGGKPVKSVSNMSLGGGKSPALDLAIERSIERGLLFAVAAGNDGRDACNYSPARAKSAVTVGSTAITDKRSYFSNVGKCVDIFAPGSEITAAWIGSSTAIKTISGTSMASPHVCGVLALLAAEGDYTPAELKAKLLELASDDLIADVGPGSPNKFLFTNPPASVAQDLKFQF